MWNELSLWFAVPLTTWLSRWADFTLFCSILSATIPPVEIWNGYPRFQKSYALFVNLVSHYGALNLRGSIVRKALKNYQSPDPSSSQKPVDDSGKAKVN